MESEHAKPVMDYATPSASPPDKGSRFGRGLLGWVLFIGLAVMLFLLLNQRQRSAGVISLDELKEDLAAGLVQEISIENDQLYCIYPTGPQPVYRVTLPVGLGSDWGFVHWLLDNNNGARITADNQTNLFEKLLLPLIPWLLVFGFIWFFIFRQLRKNVVAQPAQQKPIPVYIVPPEMQ